MRQLAGIALIAFALSPSLRASDHGDTPLLDAVARPDAKISDLHVFASGDKLVLALSTNVAIPTSATSYVWPADLTLKMMIDSDSEVTFTNPADLAEHGGTIVEGDKVSPEIVFEFQGNGTETPTWKVTGLNGKQRKDVEVWVGLRDDPFIRGPRQGRNIAAIVVQFPMAYATGDDGVLLAWATSNVPDVIGPIADHAGRSLRSMFPENDGMNVRTPRNHARQLGVQPDVIIYDTNLPALYPNGRRLEDDVVDLVGDPRVTTTDAPFPATNDVPFLTSFPYLAPPH